MTKTLLVVALLASAAPHAPKPTKGASAKLVYEDASDEEVAAYFAEGQPKVTCVAANTKSGCK